MRIQRPASIIRRRGATPLEVPRGLLLCLVGVPLFLAADPGSVGSGALGLLVDGCRDLGSGAFDALLTLLDPESYRAIVGAPTERP